MSRENLRQLFLDFIDIGELEATISYFIDIGEDEEAWQRYLETYDDLLAEVKRLHEELNNIKSSVQYRLKANPSAFGAAIESRVMLHEWDEYEEKESVAELKKLTRDEYFFFCAGDCDADGFWNDEWTQEYHDQMLRFFIEAQVKYLEAEGGVEKLRQRLQKDYGDEE